MTYWDTNDPNIAFTPKIGNCTELYWVKLNYFCHAFAFFTSLLCLIFLLIQAIPIVTPLIPRKITPITSAILHTPSINVSKAGKIK